jgi:hypothetical protein
MTGNGTADQPGARPARRLKTISTTAGTPTSRQTDLLRALLALTISSRR